MVEYLNDLWYFDIVIKQWKWISNNNNETIMIGLNGKYPSITGEYCGYPSGRQNHGMSCVTTNEGKKEIIIIGGEGYPEDGSYGILGDVWKFSIERQNLSNPWQFVNGSKDSFDPFIILLKSGEYDNKCDVFSFGILIFVLITEKHNPYGNFTNVEIKVSEDENFLPKVGKVDFDEVPNWLIDLMKVCWSHKSSDLPSFEEIIQTIKNKKGIEENNDLEMKEESIEIEKLKKKVKGLELEVKKIKKEKDENIEILQKENEKLQKEIESLKGEK